MRRLLVLTSVLILTEGGLVRIPKIYNALISSDENLSPSHAIPVVEPVIRTTALGVAFPPIIVHPTFIEQRPIQQNTNKKQGNEASAGTEVTDKASDQNVYKKIEKPIIPQISYHGSLYPLTFDPYYPYAYPSEFLYPSLPYYHQPVLVDFSHFNGNGNVNSENKNNKKEEQPVKIIANFKKNPEIPDVPPPPLPVKNDNKKKM